MILKTSLNKKISSLQKLFSKRKSGDQCPSGILEHWTEQDARGLKLTGKLYASKTDSVPIVLLLHLSRKHVRAMYTHLNPTFV